MNESCSTLEECAHAHGPCRCPRSTQETKDSGRGGGGSSWEWSGHHHEPWKDEGLGEGVKERKRGSLGAMGKEMAPFLAICGLDDIASGLAVMATGH